MKENRMKSSHKNRKERRKDAAEGQGQEREEAKHCKKHILNI
jgi:hypothetical protein